MTNTRRRLRAAFLFVTVGSSVSLAAGFIGGAAAQSQAVEVPAYRQLAAGEAMAAPGGNGSDYSANAPSLAGLTLLATLPAAAVPRRGYIIQAQCAAGLTIVFDDATGALTPTVMVLGGGATNGAQGGSVSMAGMPHTGRIRIYSSSAGCQMAARVW